MIHSLKTMFEGKKYFRRDDGEPNVPPMFRGKVERQTQPISPRSTMYPNEEVQSYRQNASQFPGGPELKEKQFEEFINTKNECDADKCVVHLNSRYGQTDVRQTLIGTERMSYQDKKVNIEFDSRGIISADSMMRIVSDLDGSGVSEGFNRSWIRRTLFGGGTQKFSIGEQQLYQTMKDAGMTTEAINQLYQRITGNRDSLILHKSDFEYARQSKSEIEDGKMSVLEPNRATKAKIEQFRNSLIDEVDAVATMSELLSGTKGMKNQNGDEVRFRTGLASVILGKADPLLKSFDNPVVMKRLHNAVQALPVSGAEKQSLIQKFAQVLIKIGIGVGGTILTGIPVSAYIEGGKVGVNDLVDVGTKNGKTSEKYFNREELSLTKTIGEKGSVSANVDLLLARLNFNWYDPTTTSKNALVLFSNAKTLEDKERASTTIKDKVVQSLAPSKQNLAQSIANDFERHQKILLSTMRSKKLPANNEEWNAAMLSNVNVFVAKIARLNGAKLSGVFLAYSMGGFSVGPQWSNTTTVGNNTGLSEYAGIYEADVLGGVEINEAERNRRLQELGISVVGNRIYHKGKPIDGVIIQPGEQIAWKITKVRHPDYHRDFVTAQIYNPGTGTTRSIQLNFTNDTFVNASVKENAQGIAQAMQRGKHNKNRRQGIRAFQDAASAIDMTDANSIQNAEQSLRNAFRGDKKMMQQIESALSNTQNLFERGNTIKQFLRKTSGGTASHEIARSIRTHGLQGAPEKIEQLYQKQKLAEAFSRQFPGLSPQRIMQLVGSIARTENQPNGRTFASSLGGQTRNGFHALEGYSQGPTTGFRALNLVRNETMGIFGEPQPLNDSESHAMRAKFMSNIDARVIQQVAQSTGLTNEAEIKQVIAGGPMYAYLSYDEYAECFNFGVMVLPGAVHLNGNPVIIPDTIGSGTVLGSTEVWQERFGVGFGIPEKPDTPPPGSPPPGSPPPGSPPPGSPPPGSPPTTTTTTTTTVPGVTTGKTFTQALQSRQEVMKAGEELTNNMRTTNLTDSAGFVREATKIGSMTGEQINNMSNTVYDAAMAAGENVDVARAAKEMTQQIYNQPNNIEIDF